MMMLTLLQIRVVARVQIGPAEHVSRYQHKQTCKTYKRPDLLKTQYWFSNCTREDLNVEIDKLSYDQKWNDDLQHNLASGCSLWH